MKTRIFGKIKAAKDTTTARLCRAPGAAKRETDKDQQHGPPAHQRGAKRSTRAQRQPTEPSFIAGNAREKGTRDETRGRTAAAKAAMGAKATAARPRGQERGKVRTTSERAHTTPTARKARTYQSFKPARQNLMYMILGY